MSGAAPGEVENQGPHLSGDAPILVVEIPPPTTGDVEILKEQTMMSHQLKRKRVARQPKQSRRQLIIRESTYYKDTGEYIPNKMFNLPAVDSEETIATGLVQDHEVLEATSPQTCSLWILK